MSIIYNLVTDRTQADVDRLQELTKKGLEVTTEEPADRFVPEVVYLMDANEDFLVDSTGAVLMVVTKPGTSHKGAYNAADLNRVGYAILYVAGLYNQYGYNLTVNPKTDWSDDDYPTASQMKTYLNDIQTVRNAAAVFPTTPDAPETMEGLGWKTANSIEQILIDMDRILSIIMTTFIPCGEAICGGDNL